MSGQTENRQNLIFHAINLHANCEREKKLRIFESVSIEVEKDRQFVH